MLNNAGVSPPANTPRTELDAPAILFLVVVVVSPKSCAFPVVAIVTNSIPFVVGDILVCPKIPRVGEENPVLFLCAVDIKSPKSVAFPSAAIVT